MKRHEASFRDPSGYVYRENGALLRHIGPLYMATFRELETSGLFESLISRKLLIPHQEVSTTADAIIIKPEFIPLVTYPYEWSFLQYKHAALLTLRIQKTCLEYGFSLKDATAFNVTFHQGRPVFIDTLSAEKYTEGEPWRAYGQFLSHFLAPLVLSSRYGLHFLKALQLEPEGIPVDRFASLLPWTSKFHPVLGPNVHLTARFSRKNQGEVKASTARLSKAAQLKMIDSLYAYVSELQMKQTTEWDHYYQQTNYSEAAHQIKKQAVMEWGKSFHGQHLLDLGGNDGTFSRLLPESAFVITPDIDANAVGQHYRQILEGKSSHILPLVADFLNPAPGIGFNNTERTSLLDRLKSLPVHGCLALAVIHHISLSGNVPFEMSAALFADLAPSLLIEFPDRDDSWVTFLLESKREFRSHFDWYHQQAFEAAYLEHFELERKVAIEGTRRTLYYFRRK